MNIPVEAVEAAVKVIRADTDKALTSPLPELIRTILEAAAPHMLAKAWDECNNSDTPWINPYRSQA